MAWTQADLDKLKANYAQGYKSAQYEDKIVTFFTIEEFEKLAALMQADIDATANANGGARSTYASTARD